LSYTVSYLRPKVHMTPKTLLLLVASLWHTINVIAGSIESPSSSPERLPSTQHASQLLPNHIIYVNKNIVGGNGSGSSWNNAIPELADALLWAKQNEVNWETNPLQIWVAAGTYMPKYRPDNLSGNNPTDRSNSFLMVKNVSIFGGFAGNETNMSSRDWRSNETILSGDFNENDVITNAGQTLTITQNWDNAEHVVIAAGEVGQIELNGFLIKGGHAYTIQQDQPAITVNQHAVHSSGGGGIFLTNTSLSIRNCIFFANKSYTGAAVYTYQSNILVTHSEFSRNWGVWGGAASINTSNSKFANNLFSGNHADIYGPGIDFSGSPSSNLVINSTFVNNYSRNYDLGVSASAAPVSIFNSIILNTAASTHIGARLTSEGSTLDIRYSLIQGLSDTQNGNIDATALTEEIVFRDVSQQDYSIPYTSPAYNKGSNALYTEEIQNPAIENDLRANPRLVDFAIDMGAYEASEITLPLSIMLSSDSGKSNTDRITNVVKPTFGGETMAEATVSLIINGHVITNTVADELGNWSITVNQTLEDGNYSVTAAGSKPGYVTLSPPPIQVTIDATAPIITGVTEGETYNIAKTITYNEGSANLNSVSFTSGSIIGVNDSYTLIVEDIAGNISQVSFTINRISISPGVGNIVYVNKNVQGGTGEGNSWANAVSELADALVYAQTNKTQWSQSSKLQIWVAAGTYKPLYSPADNNFGHPAGRENTFLMVKYVDVYGGFSGSETNLSQRNWNTNKTVLDGDLHGNDLPNLEREQYQFHDSRQDNAYHVVLYIRNEESNTFLSNQRGSILDGFTIKNGNANDFDVNLTVNATDSDGFMGGGINSRLSFPVINNVILTTNSGYSAGAISVTYARNGGVTNYYKIYLTNSLLDKNHGHYGGSALYTPGSVGLVTNCTFVNHTGGEGYIGSVIYGANTTIVNCIALNNPGIRFLQSAGDFDPSDFSKTYNSLIHGNTNLTNGNLDATNVTASDLFTDPATGDYQVKAGSATIDAGNISKFLESGLSSTSKDLAANPRIMGGNIDMGPFEMEVACPTIAAPVVTASQGFCETQPLSNLAATPATNYTLLWYETASGGSPLDAQINIQNGAIYYAASATYGCESALRTPVTVTITGFPNTPVVNSIITFEVNADAVPLTVTSEPNHTLHWYDRYENPISEPTPNTSVVGSTKYYVSQRSEFGCESSLQPITINVQPKQIIPNDNGVVFVNKNILGGNKSGNTWANAAPDLAEVLEFAKASTNIREIWVAAGTYQPKYSFEGSFEDEEKYNTFPIANLKLYGGFSGSESNLNQRNWKNNATILNGNIGDPADDNDNVYSVVASYEAISETVLDGFIVERASGQSGMIAVESDARHIINHVIFRNNFSLVGGGLYVVEVINVIISNTLFTGNMGIYGGAVASLSESPSSSTLVINSVFTDNIAMESGGAIISLGAVNIHNSIFWKNTLNELDNISGADIAPEDPDLQTSSPSIFNSITQVYTGATSPGARSTNGVIVGQDPGFTNPSAQDFTLLPGSPAIDAGDNSAYDSALLGTRDLAGVDRIRNNSMDIGAFEVQQGNNPLPVTLVSLIGAHEHGLVTLRWKTSEELNSSHFIVERSSNGTQFTAAGNIRANQIGNHTYSYEDLGYTLLRTTYYRLKMVDLDGSFTYSRIINVTQDAKNLNRALSAYPNPAIAGKQITVESSSAGTATLIDIKGISKTTFKLNQGSNLITLPLLSPGIYFISHSDAQVVRIVVL
jgi:hypothetical protein